MKRVGRGPLCGRFPYLSTLILILGMLGLRWSHIFLLSRRVAIEGPRFVGYWRLAVLSSNVSGGAMLVRLVSWRVVAVVVVSAV